MTARGGKFIAAAFAVFAALAVSSCASPQRSAMEICTEVFQEHWGRDWDKVIELTTEAIALEPDFPWPYSQRGVAYSVKGDYKLAMKDLNTALLLDPVFDAAYTNRAIVFMKFSNYDAAMDDVKMALKLNPGEITAMLAMAELQARSGNEKEACIYLDRALDIDYKGSLGFILSTDIFEHINYLPCYTELVTLH